MKESTYTESSGTLTLGDIKKAISLLENGDKEERLAQKKRSLKDWSKLSFFNKILRTSKMSFEEQVELGWVIQNLAEGKVLVLGEKMHEQVLAQLSEMKVPKEVLDNILVSRYLPTTTFGVSVSS